MIKTRNFNLIVAFLKLISGVLFSFEKNIKVN